MGVISQEEKVLWEEKRQRVVTGGIPTLKKGKTHKEDLKV